ncbi:MAG: cbb3-type cytochrome c oxidase subunit I [Acidimicrobiaceae bacterium]|nr:cbb3-type cytochrome c oxidase subunit I [Acidimicrobiia bacterium]MCY4492304.1 cbb3-type cytochrome c oxidase subunit I [Acidimicrobiaceae bacterium]
MTMTDSPPVADTALAAASPRVVGLFDALTTTDHKRIGRLWLRSGVLALLAATIVGVVLTVENSNSSADDIFGGVNNYFQYFSAYRFGLVLLVVAPLFVGLATVVVPMQVGATNIAFPRAAHGAVWLFMIGAGITVVSVAAGGGWGALDGVSSGERDAIALTLVGTALVIVSLLAASICIATTVVSLRTAGMNLLRVPLFAWSMLVATSVWLLTLPVALGNLALIYLDLRGGPGEYGTAGGSGAIYAQLGWLVEQPQVYAFAIPVLGVLGQIAPVAAGRRHAQHMVAVALIGLFGLLAVGGWSQPFFQGGNYDENFVFIVFGLFAVLPVLGSIGAATDTIAKRSADDDGGASASTGPGAGTAGAGISRLLSVHGLGAIGAALLLLAGTVAGLARVIQPWDLGGRTTTTAVMNLVLYGAVVAAIAGIWFWAPKISGRHLPAAMGRLVLLDLVAGAVLLGAADFVSGFLEAPAFGYQVAGSTAPLMAVPSDQNLIEVMNVVGAAGAVLIVLGVLGVVAALAKAARSDEPVEDNPYGGQTLEWATSSPPPSGNFSEPPERVVSEAPLLDTVRENGEEA